MDCIRYVAARDIQPDEELCIFYGYDLSFAPVTIQGIPQGSKNLTSSVTVGAVDDIWNSHLAVGFQEIRNPYLEGDPNEVVPQTELPFTKLRPPLDEEDHQSIRTSYVIRPNRFLRNSSKFNS